MINDGDGKRSGGVKGFFFLLGTGPVSISLFDYLLSFNRIRSDLDGATCLARWKPNEHNRAHTQNYLLFL